MTASSLPCGRDPSTVAEHAAAGTLDEHERDCPHCRAAAREASLSAELGATLAAAERDVEPSRDLVAGVMRTVRTELRTAREIPLPSPDGPAFVTDHVVTTVLRDRLDAAGGLTVASCRIEIGAEAGLRVRIAAYGRYRQDLPTEADRVRDLVDRTLHREFALRAEGGVDVDVVDLMGPGS